MNTNSVTAGNKKTTLEPVKIFDWSITSSIEVDARDYREDKSIGRSMVMLYQRAGSMYLQHSMSLEQARQMAAALIAAADFLEGQA